MKRDWETGKLNIIFFGVSRCRNCGRIATKERLAEPCIAPLLKKGEQK